MSNPNPFLRVDDSRKLHDRLVECDAALRELEADPTRYTVADYDEQFRDIMRLREQTRKEIENLER